MRTIEQLRADAIKQLEDRIKNIESMKRDENAFYGRVEMYPDIWEVDLHVDVAFRKSAIYDTDYVPTFRKYVVMQRRLKQLKNGSDPRLILIEILSSE